MMGGEGCLLCFVSTLSLRRGGSNFSYHVTAIPEYVQHGSILQRLYSGVGVCVCFTITSELR